jgi:GTP pyrophosphokinase
VRLGERFDRAMLLASELHREQWRKGTDVPYISHLLAVASLALEHGADEDEAIAALLHDAVEDQGGPVTRARIATEMGARVAALVDELSDSDRSPKPPWRERKESFVERLAQASAPALRLSACDKLHNARCILVDYRVHGEALWERFAGGRDGSMWYYRAVVDALRGQQHRAEGVTELVAELDRTVVALERLTAS